ncbi:restriction endonuclease subunit M [Candidatus Micrarchaeota archaeon CG1_02_47_40]|nr:MAG: restriction endonuclease subunit M [Candidatus Micrarchaeota archaeon CG1_02_47_40]
MKEQAYPQKETLNRGELEGILKKAADLIRTSVDYKFILIMLFLKRISDRWQHEYEKEYKKALEDGLSEKDARAEAKNPAYHSFDLPEEYTWDNIRKDVAQLPEKFSSALKTLAERNPDLKDILDNTDFTQFTSNRENAEILRQLVELFSEKNLHGVSPDILGDAYEWILRYFAPSKAKEGEIYTPREVIKLLVKMLDPKPGESVYDPAAGSAGMLILSYEHVKKNHPGKETRLFLYGQERNTKTLALGKMNMFIHDIRDCRLEGGDTLLYPKLKEGEGIKKFDSVIANPPWNQDGFGEEVLKKAEYWESRFSLGFPPQQSADWAWIQHMLASANEEKGRIGVIIDNGCLFRGGKEGAIRRKAIKWLECVILLPEKLFYNTGAPGAVLIFRKKKIQRREEKILIINASLEFEKHPDVRKLNRLGEANIIKITNAYREFSEEEGFSRIISREELQKNDFSLNVTLYVSPQEEQEEIDIEKEWAELKELEGQLGETEGKIAKHLREIK